MRRMRGKGIDYQLGQESSHLYGGRNRFVLKKGNEKGFWRPGKHSVSVLGQ